MRKGLRVGTVALRRNTNPHAPIPVADQHGEFLVLDRVEAVKTRSKLKTTATGCTLLSRHPGQMEPRTFLFSREGTEGSALAPDQSVTGEPLEGLGSTGRRLGK